jgi:RNA polymerase sigma factor (sigma-70 family)
MSTVTTSYAPKQAIPTDTATVWERSKRILFAVARKVRLSVRLKLEGRGRGEAEPEELVNDAFICLMEALPRFDPATARFTTFVYGLARRRMWLLARAAFYGLSPEQMHRMDAAKRTPHYHRGERTLRITAAPRDDAEERQSDRWIAAIRRQLHRQDRRLLDLYLQEGGNYSAVARRLRRHRTGIQARYARLFRRIKATA